MTVIALLSLARFKRADYLLPAYPGAALCVGCFGERLYLRLSASRRTLTAVLLFLIALGCIAGWTYFHEWVEPKQQAVREQERFARHIRSLAPQPSEVILFRVESHLLAFHLGRPVSTLVEWSELNETLAKPGAHWFVTRAEFVAECLENMKTRKIAVESASADFSSAPPLRALVLMQTVD